MENLTPPVLNMTRELRWLVNSGHSMNEALRLHLAQADSMFAHRVREWWVREKNHERHVATEQVFPSHYQRALLNLLDRGCRGQPTLEPLAALEDEIERAAGAELDAHVSALPFKVLLPLMLFQFPAYLILLLGPILRELGQQLSAG